jgi:hypothetical protein
MGRSQTTKTNYMESNKSKGLGDSIEKITKLTGIKKLTQMATGALGKRDCGCNKRKQALNKAFPYKK